MLQILSPASRHAARRDLLTIYAAAVDAVQGRRAVRRRLQQSAVPDAVTLVAVGKAGQSMALGAHDVLGKAIRNGLVDAETLKRAEIEGLDPTQTLRAADAGSLLQENGDLIRTGPTGTNVMDLMLGLKVDAPG